MGVLEYKSDGSFREFRNHWTHRTKAELIRELWSAAGELETLERENVELRARIGRLESALSWTLGGHCNDASKVLDERPRQSLAAIKAETLREAAREFRINPPGPRPRTGRWAGDKLWPKEVAEWLEERAKELENEDD